MLEGDRELGEIAAINGGDGVGPQYAVRPLDVDELSDLESDWRSAVRRLTDITRE